MPRSRRKDPSSAVAGLLGLGMMAWWFAPDLRPVMLLAGGIVALGASIWVVYRLKTRAVRAQAEGLESVGAARAPADPSRQPRYVTRKSVLSKAEIAFHHALLKAVPEAPIFPKVRVADVMDAAERYSADFLRISQKHFDWVLCHPVSFEPLVAIELDDSSHQRSHKQRKNDQVKDAAARDAGIVLLRFPWQPQYNRDDIRSRIATVLDGIADAKEGVIGSGSRP